MNAPTTPNAPTGRSLSNFIIRVRRAGVPHEETVIFPAGAAALLMAISGPSGWRLWLPFSAFVVIVCICAVWLAVAWRQRSFFPAFLRPIYIGALATVLWMATHDTPNTKQDIIRWIYLLSYGTVVFFLPSFIFAGLIRETVLGEKKIDYSQQRTSYRTRKKWKERLNRIWQSQFIQNSWSIQGFVALLTLISALISFIIFAIRVGVSAIFPPGGVH